MTKSERDAWALAYRLYEEYAPGLKAAAHLDDDNAIACGLFTAALKKITEVYSSTDPGGQLILLAVYGILESTFKDARECARNAPVSLPDAGGDKSYYTA